MPIQTAKTPKNCSEPARIHPNPTSTEFVRIQKPHPRWSLSGPTASALRLTSHISSAAAAAASARSLAAAATRQGLADIARHVVGWYLNDQTRVKKREVEEDEEEEEEEKEEQEEE